MMKKILVLVLLFGIASVANAGLFISVNGDLNPVSSEIFLEPSQTAVIDIHGDGQSRPGVDNPYLVVAGPGLIAGGVVLYPGTLSDYMDLAEMAIVAGITEEEFLGYFKDYAGIDAVDAGWAILDDGTIPQAPLQGVLVDDIILHCEAIGDVELTLLTNDFATVLDSVIIHQVPEPITFALLGLGGLFLRRRK